MEAVNLNSGKCRFPSCQWTGDIDSLYDHCATYHAMFVKEISKDNRFTFSFDEILKETYLLNANEGLYWFLLDPKDDDKCIRRGIFAIGESEICDYTTKVGTINVDGNVTLQGPYKTQHDSNLEKYEIEWSYLHLEFLNEELITKSMEIYFGEYDYQEEYTGTYHDVDWSDPEEVECNKICVEKFTCFVCYEFIRKNARFCENSHFLCSACLTKLIEQNKLKCPMCRADFPYDCDSQEVEELLRCVRFPEDA